MSTPAPTFAGFVSWVRANLGIDTSKLPDADPVWQCAYDVAIALVNQQLQAVPGPIYKLAVYNLGADNLVNWADDPENAPLYKDDKTYFVWLRSSLNVNNFIPGFITSASDEGTSASTQFLEQLKDMTLSQLQNTKTPWGRAYLGYASAVGSLWGLS